MLSAIRKTLPVHPRTGRPIEPLGVRKNGQLIWPILGGDGTDDGDGGEGGSGDSDKDKPKDKPSGGERGFPENTPLAEMTVEQREAYWKHQARRHESTAKSRSDYDDLKKKAEEFDKLSEASKTENEKAVDAARAEGRADALNEVGGTLVDAAIQVAAAGKIPAEQLATLVEHLDRSKFLDADGKVDTVKVASYVASIAPGTDDKQEKKRADLGQGRRKEGKPDALAVGRERARERFGTGSEKK